MWKKLKEMHIYEMYFSLYAMDCTVHDDITKIRNSFKKTLNSIEQSKKMGFVTNINSVVMKNNYEEIIKI
jgi:MoaA/NifB/PqqE/SkfB family radical SAM enzyme